MMTTLLVYFGVSENYTQLEKVVHPGFPGSVEERVFRRLKGRDWVISRKARSSPNSATSPSKLRRAGLPFLFKTLLKLLKEAS